MATDLLTAFNEACELWNAANYDKLAERFDADIIMKKLDDAGSIVGIGNALVYLNANQLLKHPKLEQIKAEKPLTWASDTIGQVSGTAQYKDKTKPADGKITPVRFTFTFTRANDTEEWLIANAFQARLQ